MTNHPPLPRDNPDSPTKNLDASTASSSLSQEQSTPPLTGPVGSGEREPGASPEHDAWRHGALGERGWHLATWLRFHPGPHTRADLAQCTGLKRGTVYRLLAPNGPLVRYGLVERTPDGRITAGVPPETALLDRIAAEMGTAGRHAALLAKLREHYQKRGLLDDNGYWLDSDTGQRKAKASWL